MNKQLQNCAARTIGWGEQPILKVISKFKVNSYFRRLLFLGVIFSFSNVALSTGVVNITSTVTWSSVGDVPSDALDYGISIVYPGNLTISGLDLFFYPSVGIYVGYGCKLTVTNSKLSLFNAGSNTYWNGINYNDPDICDAQSEEEQFSTFPIHTTLNNNAAWEGTLVTGSTAHPVVVINNSTIERAKVGVFSKCGQIVRATGSEFINCETGAWLAGYESTVSPHVNASYFMDCIFKWTLPNTYYTQTSLIGIKLNGVKGINIGGCTFTNERFATTCPNERGRGIVAQNSEFILSMSGNSFCNDNSSYSCSNNCYVTGSTSTSHRNTFEKLFRGIETTLNGRFENPATAIVIRNSDFTNNFNSVNLDGGMFKILDCTFTGSRTTLDGTFTTGACYSSTSTIKDVELDQTHEYEIYASTFTFTGKDVKHILMGGQNFGYSRIQNNSFTNNTNTTVATDNVTGMIFLRENSQTEIKCNTFTDMGTDILVGGSNTIKATQGTSGLGAGNQFSSRLSGRFRLDNRSGTLIVYDYDHLGSDIFDPVTTPNSASTMGLDVLTSSSSNAEGTNCQITCMNFLSSIKSVSFAKEAFNIIPQPANNEMKISLLNNYRHYTYYCIYNIQGKLIDNKPIEDINNIIINTSELNNGIYVLRLIDEKNQSIAKKLLIQH